MELNAENRAIKFLCQNATSQLTLKVTLMAYLSDNITEAVSEFNVIYLAATE